MPLLPLLPPLLLLAAVLVLPPGAPFARSSAAGGVSLYKARQRYSSGQGASVSRIYLKVAHRCPSAGNAPASPRH